MFSFVGKSIDERFCACKEEKQTEYGPVTGYGLHVASNGTITLNGKAFYGMGLVWKDAFKMRLNNPNVDLTGYFEKLSEGKVPYVRIMMGVDNVEDAAKFENDNTGYFAAMDYVVEMATAWCFANYAVNDKDSSSIEVGTTSGIMQNKYAWDGIFEVNTKYIEDGKNQAADYWETAVMLLDK